MRKGLGIIAGIIGVLITICGIVLKVKDKISVSIIGGADGPTSIFLAGSLGGDFSVSAIIAGILLMAVAAILLFKKRR